MPWALTTLISTRSVLHYVIEASAISLILSCCFGESVFVCKGVQKDSQAARSVFNYSDTNIQANVRHDSKCKDLHGEMLDGTI